MRMDMESYPFLIWSVSWSLPMIAVYQRYLLNTSTTEYRTHLLLYLERFYEIIERFYALFGRRRESRPHDVGSVE